MKYIIIESLGCDVAILFDDILGHDDVARGRKVISAGFCSRFDGEVWGESVSLKLKSREDDKYVVRHALDIQ